MSAGRHDGVAKRLFDVTVAVLGLVLTGPLLAVFAAWVKLDSPGPVLFRQLRVGRFGTPFFIHKFRTMTHAPQATGPQITVGADPRITRAGTWLRRYKLDELPQLYDVLRGAMSLVGPRPEVPRYVAMYPPDVREKVLSVRPGITDLASIEFRDESELLARTPDPEREYVDVVLPRKLELAVRYVENRSVRTDLGLICRTLAAVWR